MLAGYLGQIITPAAGNALLDGPDWIADNAVFSNKYPGDSAYLAWLDSHAHLRFRCRFAVAPDVVCSHEGTLARSLPVLPRIRKVVGRAAFVAQNGAHPGNVPWDDLDAIFLGGGPECLTCSYVRHPSERVQCCPNGHPLAEWKIGEAAAFLTAAAKRLGKWVHMGRVNSQERVERAIEMGCDSADGTYLAFGPDINLPRLLSWLYPDDFRFIRVEQVRRRTDLLPDQDSLFDWNAA